MIQVTSGFRIIVLQNQNKNLLISPNRTALEYSFFNLERLFFLSKELFINITFKKVKCPSEEVMQGTVHGVAKNKSFLLFII